MSTLEGKIAFVTGASSGLGAETARLLSRQGATVFGIGRDTARLAEVFGDVAHGTYAAVDIASASAAVGAVTLALAVPAAGHPLRGSST